MGRAEVVDTADAYGQKPAAPAIHYVFKIKGIVPTRRGGLYWHVAVVPIRGMGERQDPSNEWVHTVKDSSDSRKRPNVLSVSGIAWTSILLTVILWIVACAGQAKNTHRNAMPQGLIGRWLWVGSYGGFPPRTKQPGPNGPDYSIQFAPDSTYVEYADSIVLVRSAYRSGEFKAYWSADTLVPGVFLDNTKFFKMFAPGDKFALTFTHDTLTLVTPFDHTWWHQFIRSTR